MIKSYQMFLESSNHDKVAAICDKYNIENWVINPDTGLVDINGNVRLDNHGLTKLPIKFGKISGYFSCDSNDLSSLEDFPKEIKGDLICNYNKITSLEGLPILGHSIYFGNNRLTSLNGSPEKVNGHFSCSNNLLTSLEGCPKEIRGIFWCNKNALTSLEGFVSAISIHVNGNLIENLSLIGHTMIKKKISFLDAIIIHIKEIPDNELVLIFKDISAQKILDLNDFKILNLLRTNLPEKYAEVMSLRNVDLSADLGELGF